MFVCDFCSEPNPRWSYAARDVFLHSAGVVQQSVGAWAACDQCAAIIELGDRDGLFRRGLFHFRERFGESDVEDVLRAIHAAFFVARTGDRQRLL